MANLLHAVAEIGQARRKALALAQGNIDVHALLQVNFLPRDRPMSAPTLMETDRFTNRLTNAGFQRSQAEAMSEALRDELCDVATKGDVRDAVDNAVEVLRAEIRETDASLRAEIRETDASLRAEIRELGNQLRLTDGKLDAMQTLIRTVIFVVTFGMAVLALMIALSHVSPVLPPFLDDRGPKAAPASQPGMVEPVPTTTTRGPSLDPP